MLVVERDIAPDVLSGFALLGILLVNIPFMALFSEEAFRGQWVEGFPNSAATVIIYGLFAGKFYILFAFLFGYSANYIIKGEPTNRSRWAKRALFLIFMGAVHFSLFWHGDILFLYGIWALLLIPFLFRTEKTLKIWSWSIYIFFGLLLTASAIALIVAEKLNPAAVDLAPSPLVFDEVMQNGGFIEALGPRIELWILGIATGIFLQSGFVFAAFLVGRWAYVSKFPDKYADTISANTSIDADANSFAGIRAVLFVAYLLLLIRTFIGFSTKNSSGLERILEGLAIGQLAFFPVTAPLQAMLLPQGLGFLFLALLIIRKNLVSFSLYSKREISGS